MKKIILLSAILLLLTTCNQEGGPQSSSQGDNNNYNSGNVSDNPQPILNKEEILTRIKDKLQDNDVYTKVAEAVETVFSKFSATDDNIVKTFCDLVNIKVDDENSLKLLCIAAHIVQNGDDKLITDVVKEFIISKNIKFDWFNLDKDYTSANTLNSFKDFIGVIKDTQDWINSFYTFFGNVFNAKGQKFEDETELSQQVNAILAKLNENQAPFAVILTDTFKHFMKYESANNTIKKLINNLTLFYKAHENKIYKTYDTTEVNKLIDKITDEVILPSYLENVIDVHLTADENFNAVIKLIYSAMKLKIINHSLYLYIFYSKNNICIINNDDSMPIKEGPKNLGKLLLKDGICNISNGTDELREKIYQEYIYYLFSPSNASNTIPTAIQNIVNVFVGEYSNNIRLNEIVYNMIYAPTSEIKSNLNGTKFCILSQLFVSSNLFTGKPYVNAQNFYTQYNNLLTLCKNINAYSGSDDNKKVLRRFCLHFYKKHFYDCINNETGLDISKINVENLLIAFLEQFLRTYKILDNVKIVNNEGKKFQIMLKDEANYISTTDGNDVSRRQNYVFSYMPKKVIDLETGIDYKTLFAKTLLFKGTAAQNINNVNNDDIINENGLLLDFVDDLDTRSFDTIFKSFFVSTSHKDPMVEFTRALHKLVDDDPMMMLGCQNDKNLESFFDNIINLIHNIPTKSFGAEVADKIHNVVVDNFINTFFGSVVGGDARNVKPFMTFIMCSFKPDINDHHMKFYKNCILGFWARFVDIFFSKIFSKMDGRMFVMPQEPQGNGKLGRILSSVSNSDSKLPQVETYDTFFKALNGGYNSLYESSKYRVYIYNGAKYLDEYYVPFCEMKNRDITVDENDNYDGSTFKDVLKTGQYLKDPKQFGGLSMVAKIASIIKSDFVTSDTQIRLENFECDITFSSKDNNSFKDILNEFTFDYKLEDFEQCKVPKISYKVGGVPLLLKECFESVFNHLNIRKDDTKWYLPFLLDYYVDTTNLRNKNYYGENCKVDNEKYDYSPLQYICTDLMLPPYMVTKAFVKVFGLQDFNPNDIRSFCKLNNFTFFDFCTTTFTGESIEEDIIMCKADINPYKNEYYKRDYRYNGGTYKPSATEDNPIFNFWWGPGYYFANQFRQKGNDLFKIY